MQKGLVEHNIVESHVTLPFDCRNLWFVSTLLKPHSDVSPWSHVYVKRAFSQRFNVNYINCRLNLNKRLKKKNIRQYYKRTITERAVSLIYLFILFILRYVDPNQDHQ